METTTATTIDDDSDDEGDADGDGDDGHNGTMTRPQRRDHGDETMTSRYNNQLNGGPLAVER